MLCRLLIGKCTPHLRRGWPGAMWYLYSIQYTALTQQKPITKGISYQSRKQNLWHCSFTKIRIRNRASFTICHFWYFQISLTWKTSKNIPYRKPQHLRITDWLYCTFLGGFWSVRACLEWIWKKNGFEMQHFAQIGNYRASSKQDSYINNFIL
jgi:hypothetical protein